MTIEPIRTNLDHRMALAEVERLWGADPETPDGKRLDVLLTLIDAHENVHHALPDSDPIDLIRFLMEQRGWTERDLEPVLGDAETVADILDRRAPLTVPMIRSLAATLGAPADVLIRDYPMQRVAL